MATPAGKALPLGAVLRRALRRERVGSVRGEHQRERLHGRRARRPCLLYTSFALAVHLEDLLAALEVGAIDDDLAVEATGPEQGRVEDVDAVGRRDHDDGIVGLETVHLDEQLVERLLALVMTCLLYTSHPAGLALGYCHRLLPF